ncbi:hypothetical protein PIROE2DRAFT_39697, partial [Piromyces sp. E2]
FKDFIRRLITQFNGQNYEIIVANDKLCHIKEVKFNNIYEFINEFKRISQFYESPQCFSKDFIIRLRNI